jgi:hypothetical protein
MVSTTTSISAPNAVAADPTKRVNYTFGMVLGVGDFVQMDTYREARDRLLARELIGYGTIWGLAVGTDTDIEGRDRVTVTRGVAVVPAGQPVCVAVDQCAYVGSWLRTHADSISDSLPTDGDLRAYVVLCHRERRTDNVPIPGEPCRSEDELMAPSRVQDDFSLEMRLTPPRQVAEDATRDVVDWLRQIPVIPGSGSSVEDVLDELRAAAAAPGGSPPDGEGSPPGAWSSPPMPFDALLGSPSASLAIPAGLEAEYLRTVFRVWTTELRPQWRTDIGCGGDDCLSDATCDDDCVLLAELSIPIMWEAGNAAPIVTNDPIEIIEARRPFLLQERMLQEWLLTSQSQSLWGSPPEVGVAGGSVVAAGHAGPLGGLSTAPQFGSAGVAVTRLATGIYRVTFAGYDENRRYVLTGSPVTTLADAPRLLEAVVDGGVAPPLDPSLGLHVRISTITGTAVDSPFTFQVSDYSAVP